MTTLVEDELTLIAVPSQCDVYDDVALDQRLNNADQSVVSMNAVAPVMCLLRFRLVLFIGLAGDVVVGELEALTASVGAWDAVISMIGVVAHAVGRRRADPTLGQFAALVDQRDDLAEDGVALALGIEDGRSLSGQVGQTVGDGHHPLLDLGG